MGRRKTYGSGDIPVDYREDLDELEDLLSSIQRYGDFCTQGDLSLPMPTIEIEGLNPGAGILSFPILDIQIRSLIALAERAPYGKGKKTIVDTNVRKVWQLPINMIKISGDTWQSSLETILHKVQVGLGLEGARVEVELYKMLVYDEGSFFLPHRDTEKAEGMFGTLILVLPSAHQGGELVVAHGGLTKTLDLRNQSVSKITFAGLYADCEHEVKPVTSGNRVCLIYNLVKMRGGKVADVVEPPDMRETVEEVGTQLDLAFQKEDLHKLVWILEHKYTSAELSFDALKGQDMAKAQVLAQVIEKKGQYNMAVGMVHISDSGSADVHGGSYSVIESCHTERIVNDIQFWGQEEREEDLSLEISEEVLPQGALDDISPDHESFEEASGNEGGSYERAYLCGAILIWPKKKHIFNLLPHKSKDVITYLSILIDRYMDQKGEGQDVTFVDQPPSTYGLEPAEKPTLELIRDTVKQMVDYIISEFSSNGAIKTQLEKLVMKTQEKVLMSELVPLLLKADYRKYDLRKIVPLLRPLGWDCLRAAAGIWKDIPLEEAVTLLKKLQEVEEPHNHEIKKEILAFLAKITIESQIPHYLKLHEKRYWDSTQIIKPEPVIFLWLFLDQLQDTTSSELFIQLAFDQPESSQVMPALLSYLKSNGKLRKDAPVYTTLWKKYAHLASQIREVPQTYNWRIERILCNCSVCSEIVRFCQSQTESQKVYAGNQKNKNHISNKFSPTLQITAQQNGNLQLKKVVEKEALQAARAKVSYAKLVPILIDNPPGEGSVEDLLKELAQLPPIPAWIPAV